MVNAQDEAMDTGRSPIEGTCVAESAVKIHITAHVPGTSVQIHLSPRHYRAVLLARPLWVDLSLHRRTFVVTPNIRTSAQALIYLVTVSNFLKTIWQVTKKARLEPSEEDILGTTKNVYRLLELVTEQGSGGLVDKIVIAEESLRRFITRLSPIAYTSLTRVDFKALDLLKIQPIGVYGPKDALASFLMDLGILDELRSKSLLSGEGTGGRLQSGLYAVLSSENQASTIMQVYIVYWPEKLTWHDDAPSAVRRNRVTFMRYLNKVADQILCLIPPDVLQSIVWKDDDEDVMDLDVDIEDDYHDRLFSFEVSKTTEQAESVAVRDGFHVSLAKNIRHNASLDDTQKQEPILLRGETAQGFLVPKFVEPTDISTPIRGEIFNSLRLCEFFATGTIILDSDFSYQSFEILIRHGIQKRFPDLCAKWIQGKLDVDRDLEEQKMSMRKQSEEEMTRNKVQLEDLVYLTYLENCKVFYPENLLSLVEKSPTFQRKTAEGSDPSDLMALYPQMRPELNKILRNKNLDKISSAEYRKLKKQLIAVQVYQEESKDKSSEDREEMTRKLVNNEVSAQESSGLLGFLSKLVGWEDATPRINNRASQLADSKFLRSLEDLSIFGGDVAQDLVTKILNLASEDLQSTMNKSFPKLMEAAERIQKQACFSQIESALASKKQEKYSALRVEFAEDLERQSRTASDNKRVLFLTKLEVNTRGHYSYYAGQNVSQASSFKVFATEKTRTDPYLDYKVNVLELTSEDRQNMQLDPTFVPTPAVNERLSYSFSLPPEYTILHAQLLPEAKLLLLIDDRKDTILVFCDTLSQIGNTVQGRRSRKQIRREKTGPDVVIAFDEGKRMLALCATSKFLLYIFVFDEPFSMLHSWANAVNLKPWYDAGQQICHACFVAGNEELLLVDNQAQGRIFSLNTQQCRPASLNLQQIPAIVLSSPDGACFLVVFNVAGGAIVRAFHWATFGSTNGIDIAIDLDGAHPLTLTSFVNRANVHLLVLNSDAASCRSFVLDITKKSTEFTFREKSALHLKQKDNASRVHNCLLDCHSDMWTRFPVLPAVRRQTKTQAMQRPKLLLLITSDDRVPFSSYFTRMVRDFEQKTRKPTGEELSSINVNALSPESYKQAILQDLDSNISCFQAGEWLVDLLCLIPIHIAITRDNRFIPLKDGVSSAAFEKSLLGAEMSAIVDSISFGWYEPILQSYMSTKPVKVVSSMGEQSVGKSYALNHLLDTSFAGSAMRTTEGVWMSVTPTDEVLLVALDFEGVHSIERSAQEDTLLVLFNTAVSNLVLFRNNFALSRDITGLFQSFQSSASVFDPAANPGLFRSTLAIIIKDVVDSDKKEIVKEFSLKFQKIVQEEQESNFISRLHAGQLKIIPWPVIESKQFYSLFPALKGVLDKQFVTHQTAGGFLHTLKTLMAKLKANDWRALSQSMVAHRVHQLLSMLPNALAFGYGELEPHQEELKNFDTDSVISFADTPAKFFLSTLESQVDDRDLHLRELCKAWPGYQLRQAGDDDAWIEELSAYIFGLVDTRINHVNLWISKNLENFQTGTQASIATLDRSLAAAIIDIRSNVELCKQQCSSCQLHCTLSRRHGNKPHDCDTSHKCTQPCEFVEGHPSGLKPCGYPAGHTGKHVCVVEDHLCGEPCALKDKAGCLGECTQVAGHKGGDHRCSARVHYCGKPCQLVLKPENKGSTGASSYSCPGTCTTSSDIEHEDHTCDNRMCPLQCQLCKRLCASDNHLHALEETATHLCGESHSCHALCSTTNGICEIETMPQSIEATFTGQHSTFQYTKYSQVAKRLQCAIVIPPMELTHPGQHCHSTDANPFHFCETRCQYCGYYCTLPRGHSQQEHETSHGSMSRSRWALETEDAVLELNGRKFGSDDDGAPMLCNLFCQEMGRHVHLDYCRADSPRDCGGQDIQHVTTRISPHPDRPKDWITHELFWKRSGFKDPYSRDDRANFAKCDAMCPGPEHVGTSTNPVQASFCTLPMFHPPYTSNQGVGLGYASSDGHLFSCKNPALMQQAFHVMFVIDRSGSMSSSDKRPLTGTPVSNRIALHSNNRLGAVYSSLYAFWQSRVTAVTTGRTGPLRRDAYSVILFDHTIVKCIENDFSHSPEQLVDSLLRYGASGGTDYASAVKAAEEVMRQHWSTERVPVVIFLSDGECNLDDANMRTLCRAAVALGKPLSFHGVSFGPHNQILRRMAQIAREIQNSVPPDPMQPAAAAVESSFAEALDSVRLAETFLGIAESLKKPRGALVA